MFNIEDYTTVCEKCEGEGSVKVFNPNNRKGSYYNSVCPSCRGNGKFLNEKGQEFINFIKLFALDEITTLYNMIDRIERKIDEHRDY